MNEESQKTCDFAGPMINTGAGLLSPYLRVLGTGLLALLIASTLILAWVPPVSRDALTHHLIVPKLFLQHGGPYEIPSIVFSYYPMNLDLLYMIPLYFGNDIAPKLIHFTFAVLTAWLIFRYLKKRIDRSWALVGAIFFLSLPIIVKLSITAYVDLGLVFFSTASIVCLFEWHDDRCRLKYLVLAGACCGLALGTKYNGLIVWFILTIFVPFIFLSNTKTNPSLKNPARKGTSINRPIKAIGFGAIFFMVALLVFSPWMIRNYVWKANPIYPLYNNVFNPQIARSPNVNPVSYGLEPAANQQQIPKTKSTHWGPLALRTVMYGDSWWEIGLLPVRIFFQGQDDNPKYFDGKLSPFLFCLPFFAFMGFKNNGPKLQTEKKILLFFSISFVLLAFSQASIRIRYVAPIIAPLVMLAILGFHDMTAVLARRWKSRPHWFATGCIVLLVGGLLAYNGVYIYQQFKYVKPFSYLSGAVSRDEYIAGYRPEYAIYQYANRNLPDDAKILGLFLGNRRYYSERDVIFGKELFRDIVNKADSEDMFLGGLNEKGITHLAIRFDLFNRWNNRQFNDNKKEMLKQFFAGQLRHLFSKDGYGLFELRLK